MTIEEGKKIFLHKLKKIYSIREIDYYYKYLLREYFNRSPIELALNPNSQFQNSEVKLLEKALSKLLREMPIQYIIGKTYFRNLNLKVNQKVLIPRTETEELVDWIIDDHNTMKENQKVVLDIGTGSGCIAIALAKEQPLFTVLALDKDMDIIKLAKANAKSCGVNIEFFKQDITHMGVIDLKFDIIVSNPPYVIEKEKQQMKRSVLNYEPHKALFVPKNDPLIFYRYILEFSRSNLNSHGFLYFEINPLLLEGLNSLIDHEIYTVLERMDIFGKVRMLRLQKH